MTTIASTNVLYPAYRNAVAASAATYTMATLYSSGTGFALNLYAQFSDDADVTPDDGHVYISSYAAGENPSYANKLLMTNVTSGVVATGVVDFDNMVFTGSSVVATGDPVESLIVSRFITSAAASPVLAHYGSATGLPLTPNNADVTVVVNSSGAWKY